MNLSAQDSIFSESINIVWAGEELTIDGRRILFWPKEEILIVADLHIGKAGHFRRAGIAVPAGVSHGTLERLADVLKKYNPKKILILGDLFHSSRYEDLSLFSEFKSSLDQIDWVVVQGNHDRGFRSIAEKLNIDFHPQALHSAPFVFHHGNLSFPILEGQYGISAHVHPGIVLNGRGGQKEKIPCFIFRETEAVIPAFGEFTGLFPVDPRGDDAVFGIVGKKICRI